MTKPLPKRERRQDQTPDVEKAIERGKKGLSASDSQDTKPDDKQE